MNAIFSLRPLSSKIVSWLTLACFCLSCVILPAWPAPSLPLSEGRGPTGAVAPWGDDQSLVPREYGLITSESYAPGGRLVLYIQDLHCNPEVQRNIASILKYLDDKVRIGTIFLEGAPAGKINTALYSTISNKAVRDGAIEWLMDKGLLTGGEYYALTRGQDKLRGIEQWGAYVGNLERYRSLSADKDSNRKICANLRACVKTLEKDRLNRKLRRVERVFSHERDDRWYARLGKQASRAGVPLTDYPNLSRYSEMLRLSRTIHAERVNREVAALVKELRQTAPLSAYQKIVDGRGGRSDRDAWCRQMETAAASFCPDYEKRYPAAARYLASTRLSRDINPLALVAEENEFQDRVLAAFARNDEEKDILFLSRLTADMSDYASLSMMAARYVSFAGNKERFKAVLGKYVPVEKLVAPVVLLDSREYADYYEVNMRRNDIFSNAVAQGAQAGVRPAALNESLPASFARFSEIDVVIAGGFHQDVAAALNSKGIFCLTITPAVTRQHDETLYQQVMLRAVDLNRMMKSATAPIPLLTGLDESRFPAMVAALFENAKTMVEARQIISDLARDPLYKRFHITSGEDVEVMVDGVPLFSLEERDGQLRLTVKGNDKLNAWSEKLGEVRAFYTAVAVDMIAIMSNRIAGDKFPLITISDLDESLVERSLANDDAADIITSQSLAALISYLEAGGVFVILTGGKYERVRTVILNPIIAALRENGQTALLNNLFVMCNSGASRYEYDASAGAYTLMEVADMRLEIGVGSTPAAQLQDGAQKTDAIMRMFSELSGGNGKDIQDWIPKILKQDQLRSAIIKICLEDKMVSNTYRAALEGKDVQQQKKALESILRTMTASAANNLEPFIDPRAEPGREELTQVVFSARPPAEDPAHPVDHAKDCPYDGHVRREVYAAYVKFWANKNNIQIDVRVAGTTSIDVTPAGRDKGYGAKAFIAYYHKLKAQTILTPGQAQNYMQHVVFIGDSLDPGGNDTPAALQAGMVVHVRRSLAELVDLGLMGKLVEIAGVGPQNLVPQLRILSLIAAMRDAIISGEKPSPEIFAGLSETVTTALLGLLDISDSADAIGPDAMPDTQIMQNMLSAA